MRTARRDEGIVDGRVRTRQVGSDHVVGSTDILRRLERLPLSRVQIGLLFAGGLGYTFNAIGFGGVFGMTTAVLAAAALAALIVGLRTAGKTLEEIAAEELGPRRSAVRQRTVARARGALLTGPTST